MDAELKKEIDRIHAKLNNIMAVQRKETWLKGHDVMQVTVWDNKEKLYRARVNGYVEQKKDKVKGIIYKLESIPPIFLKQQTA